jgi:outer membrane protein
MPSQSGSDGTPARNAVTIVPPRGKLGWLTRPYEKPTIPDINLNNSDRLRDLVRGGNLYVSAQDVIALALENNLDIAIQRYGPMLNKQVTKRAEAGGILRNVGVPVISGPQSVSLSGVTASSATAATASGANVSASGGVISQVGVPIPSFDPQLVLYSDFAHTTTPQSNTVFTGTTESIIQSRTYQAQYSQYNSLGTFFQLTYFSQYNKFNSAFYNIDPFNSAYLDFQVQQNLLQGFGRSVLDRNIYVSKNNEKVSNLQFKQQLITTISAVLNLYWDLVSFYQDLKARKDELATAQALFEDNKKQVEIGTLAPIEVTRAESQVYSSQQDLLVAQTDLSQQEIVLKNALSRKGVADPLLAEVHVIPLDTIEVPPSDNLKPLDQLVQEALGRRVEIGQDRLNIESNKINLKAIKSELRPTLQVFADLRDNGLSGQPNYIATSPGYAGIPVESVPFLTGGYGNVLGQIFRRDFPNYSAGISLSIPLRNRSAQADYATNALLLRQSELTMQKALNDVRVDVQNSVIGLRQARARYDSAVKARILQQQTLDADKKKYTLGASTVFQVVTDQQTLAAAESAETQALANYTHARIAFDQALGRTLEVNHVSFDEALSGQVDRRSVLPAVLPKLEQ